MEIKWVGDLSRIEYKPGDKFVLSIKEQVSDETYERVRSAVANFLGCPTDHVIILVGDMKLGIIGEGE